jgi:hypothetical protein
MHFSSMLRRYVVDMWFPLGVKQGIDKHVNPTLFILVKSSNDNLINISTDICHISCVNMTIIIYLIFSIEI